jgi:hypothetical protein
VPGMQDSEVKTAVKPATCLRPSATHKKLSFRLRQEEMLLSY